MATAGSALVMFALGVLAGIVLCVGAFAAWAIAEAMSGGR